MNSFVWSKWRRKQIHMKEDLAITDNRLRIWNLEEAYVNEHACSPSLNIGAGNSPIPATISCDPLVSRDVICVAEHLPFRSNTFRSVFFLSVLDHVNDDVASIREAQRALMPTGRILIMQGVIDRALRFKLRRTCSFALHGNLRRLFLDPDSILCLPWWDKYHMRHYNSRSLRAIFRNMGMRVHNFVVREVGCLVAFGRFESTLSEEALAEEIRQRTAKTVAVGNRGGCGYRAAAFQDLACKEGLESRIVMYRGHVCNQVQIGGRWQVLDPTTPENSTQRLLLEHILAGPVYGYSSDSDYMRTHRVKYCTYSLGEYSHWMQLLARKANIVTPHQIMDGVPLADDKPNVVIRHDTDGDPVKWLWMVYEENCLGVRSVTYVLPEQLDPYSEMWHQYHFKDFAFGLHSAATDRVTLRREESVFTRHFPELTFAAHGHNDPTGIPPYLSYFPYSHEYSCLPTKTSFELEKQLPYGFISILQSTGRFDGCLIDNWGIMWPTDPETFIKNMKNGHLYYMLFHPANFSLEDGLGSFLKFCGVISSHNADLGQVLMYIHQSGPEYYNNPYHPHLMRVTNYLRSNLSEGDTVVDLCAGPGVLNVLLGNSARHYRYIGVERDYTLIREAHQLHVALGLRIPKFVWDDVKAPKYPVRGDWTTLLAWESENSDGRMFDHIHDYVALGKRLIVTWLPDTIRQTKWFDPKYFTIADIDFFLKKGFREIVTISDAYENGFPQRISVLERVR